MTWHDMTWRTLYLEHDEEGGVTPGVAGQAHVVTRIRLLETQGNYDIGIANVTFTDVKVDDLDISNQQDYHKIQRP